MSTTVFLAQLWGPAMLAVGIGFFMSRDYYVKLYHSIAQENFTLLVFAMLGIMGGAAQIHFHNTWATFPEVLISFLGWGMLAKGGIAAIMPGLVKDMAKRYQKSDMMAFSGAFMLLAGAYLCWFGFM